MTGYDRDSARADGARDPWADAPTGELGDQLLPRWFVLTAIATVLVTIAVGSMALLAPRRATAPVETRRPPPAAGYTTAVGQVQSGGSAPDAYDAPCALLNGVRLAGSAPDRAQLRRGLAGLCNVTLPDPVARDVRAFAAMGGVVRFATFEATGVDSTATVAADPPTILVNTRFQRTNASWIAPLIAHDATLRAANPSSADSALAARRAEAAVCARLLGDETESRACADAVAIVEGADPIGALRDAGFD